MWAAIGSAALSIIGTGLQVEGQKRESEARMRAAREQAKIALFNAKIGERRFRMQTDALLSEQVVGFAKGGVTFEGSPVAVMEQTAAQAEMEALLIRYGGQVEASALISGAGYAGQAGQINTAATLISGGADVAQILG